MSSNNFYNAPPPPAAAGGGGVQPNYSLYAQQGGRAPSSGGQRQQYGAPGAPSSGNAPGATATTASSDDWFTPAAAPSSGGGAGTVPVGGTGPGMVGGGGGGAAAAGGGGFGYGGALPQQQQPQPQQYVQPEQQQQQFGGGPMGGPMAMGGPMGGGPIGGGAHMQGGVVNANGAEEDDYENEPPLMEELGINVPHIIGKSRAVLLPVGHTSNIDAHIMDDCDLAGPLVFALLLGGELLLSAKMHFGYIYGFGLFGCMAMTLIVSLMSPKATAPGAESVSAWRIMSILGYCLLPVNVLAALDVFLRVKHRGAFGVCLAAATIMWCTVASTRLFERSCDMRSQRYLIAYPVALLYSCFVMITIF